MPFAVCPTTMAPVRRFFGLVLCVSVAAGIATAPMLHAHDDHDSDHHAPGAIHSHFSGHHPTVHDEADDPAIEPQDDEAAVYLKLFVGAEPSSAREIAAAPHTFALHQASEAAPHRPVFVTHGHDPPYRDSSSPRGPPLLA
jgi:hypothetical protein